MNPGALLADIGNIEKIRVKPFCRENISEGHFMHSRGTGGDYHPIQRELADVLFDQVLSGIRTKIAIVSGRLHSGKGAGKTGKFVTIDCGGDIGAAVTDVDTDFLIHQA
jgi:hypothetical protein